jgi:deazaflavin-dependent oxidoreductase (nitroreductase family)
MPLPRALARFNRVVTNRVLGLIAPWVPPFAVVVHRGRSSGRTYRTPVWAFHRGGRFVMALTYGPGADWAKNIVAAGSCGLIRMGTERRLTSPRVVRATPSRRLVPGFVAVVLRTFGVRDFLVLEPAGSAVRGSAHE